MKSSKERPNLIFLPNLSPIHLNVAAAHRYFYNLHGGQFVPHAEVAKMAGIKREALWKYLLELGALILPDSGINKKRRS